MGPLFKQLEHHYDTPELWVAAIAEHRAVLKADHGQERRRRARAMQRHLNQAYKRFSTGWDSCNGSNIRGDGGNDIDFDTHEFDTRSPTVTTGGANKPDASLFATVLPKETSMLTCRIHAKEDLRVEAVEQPQVEPGQVLIRLGAGGICGSDLHYYFEGRNGSFVIREPLMPGHEASGVVAKVGAGVTRVKVGDKVAVSPSHACGRCDYCREGREQLCRNMRFLGSASLYPHVQGMFCEYFVIGERQCYPVDGDVSLGELAFAEPLAVALHAVNRGPDLLGKSVLITGAGTIGCLTVIAARLAGAKQITVSDVLDRPLATAQEVGADRVIRADRDTAGACLAAIRRGLRSLGQLRRAEGLRRRGQARRQPSCRSARCRTSRCLSSSTRS